MDSDDAPSLTNSPLGTEANRTYTYGGAKKTDVATLASITHAPVSIQNNG